MLVAAEKVNQCRLYDLEGNQEEVIWKNNEERCIKFETFLV